jgi:succinoglycan biosynthesis protein ExoA
MLKTDALLMVSIIVPCKNEITYINSFIQSLMKQDFKKLKYEILIADGGSSDGTRNVLDKLSSEHQEIKVIDNPEQIVSTGLNKAIKMASGDIIVRMDVHADYSPDYINKCTTVLIQTGADNVGGPAQTKSKSYIHKAISIAYHSPFSVGGARFHDISFTGNVDTVTYGCWWKSKLEELGLFDEELVRNQDDELNLRIIRSGGKIWQSSLIKSWYYPRSSIRALFNQYKQYGYWKVRVIQKHRLPASLRHLIPGSFVAALIFFGALSTFNSLARLTFVVLAGLYLATNVLVCGVTCFRPHLLRYFPIMPLVFSAYHFGYGYGFLRGVVDFILMRKRGQRSFASLTR